MLLSSGAVYEDEHGLLRWNEDFKIDDTQDVDSTGYSWDMQIKALCDTGSLVLIADDKGNRDLFMWEYPVEFLKAFDEIEILTYMFKGSVFEKYLDFYGIEHTTELGIQLPSDPFSLIHIVDSDKMNRVGDRHFALSVEDQRRYVKDSAVAKDIRANLENYFKNTTYGRSSNNDRLWTCLKEAIPVFKGKGYTKRHIAQNTKAVNDYNHTYHLAYIYNSFLHPEPYKYLLNRGEQFAPDKEKYALSEMLQWIYRSRIRNNEPIHLYIPSSRMRSMLLDWMEGKII
jgi:hypothetical protein